jgi:nucleoside-diphosphate-sugar epimerase
MNILITGASGYIGSNLAAKLLENAENTIFALVRENTDLKKIPKNVKIMEYKKNIFDLIEKFKKHEIEGVAHLASLFLSQHVPADIDNLIESNILLGTHIIEAASKNNVKWFINTSSFWQHHYGKEYSPAALYAATKQSYEDILEYYRKSTPIKITTLELFDSYGPFDERKKLFYLLKNHAGKKESLDMSPGGQKMNLLYITDVVSAYIKCMLLLNGEKFEKKYSVFSNKMHILKEVVKIYSDVYDVKLNINWGGRPYREREIMNPETLYPKIPGWRQSFDLEDGIKEMKNIEESKIYDK